MSRGVRIRGHQRESGGPAPTGLRAPRVAGSAAAQAVILWPDTGAQMFKACLWGDDCVATDAMLRGWILSCPFEIWCLRSKTLAVGMCMCSRVCVGGHASVQKGGKETMRPSIISGAQWELSKFVGKKKRMEWFWQGVSEEMMRDEGSLLASPLQSPHHER